MNKLGFWVVALISFALLWWAIIKFFIPSVQAPTKDDLRTNLIQEEKVEQLSATTSINSNTSIEIESAIATSIDSVTAIEPTTPVTTESPSPSNCQAAGGTWSGSYHECENVSADWCRQQGGQFKECASACRHNEAEGFCIMQCIPVCQL